MICGSSVRLKSSIRESVSHLQPSKWGVLTARGGHAFPLDQNLLQMQKEGSCVLRNTKIMEPYHTFLTLFPYIHQPFTLKRMPQKEMER